MNGSTTATLPRRSFGETMRADVWWLQPLLVFLGLSTFIVYSTWAAFQGAHYYFGNYVSPFYSPGIFGDSPHTLVWAETELVAGLAFVFARASDSLGARRISTHLLLLSRRLLQSVLGRSAGVHRRRAAQNLSRASVRSRSSCKTCIATFSTSRSSSFCILAYDVWKALWFAIQDRNFGIGVGTIVLAINVVLLGGYTFGCHSLAPFGRRISRSTFKIDIVVSGLSLRELV